MKFVQNNKRQNSSRLKHTDIKRCSSVATEHWRHLYKKVANLQYSCLKPDLPANNGNILA